MLKYKADWGDLSAQVRGCVFSSSKRVYACGARLWGNVCVSVCVCGHEVALLSGNPEICIEKFKVGVF